jgi:signal-transduction protein with cAMP-binding, CBS, and nucleotidyltransferase domain
MTPPTKIKEIIARPLETIGISDNIQNAAIRMRDMNISSLLVVNNDGKPQGIITERDLVRKVCINDAITTSKIEIQEIMSSALLVTIDSNAAPSEAADLMLKNKVRHLLVVERRDEQHNDHKNLSKPIGIITPLDFTKYHGNVVVDDDPVEKILEFYRD